MWPLALMDGSLIVQLWPYVGAVDDSSVYCSFVELLSLPYFNSDDAVIIIIIFLTSFPQLRSLALSVFTC